MKEPTDLTDITIKTWPNGQHSVALAALRFCLGDDPLLRLAPPVAPPNATSPSATPGLELSPGQVPGQRYLVEYAPFAQTAVARFEQALAQGHVADDAAGFARFASADFTPYTAFLNHWVRSDFVQDQIVLNLADLYDNPVAWLHWVLGMLTPDQPPTPDQLDRITQAAPKWVAANPRPDLTTFRHYDAALFATLDKLILRRDVVMKTFEEIMRRPADEKAILRFQTSHNLPRLRDNLMNSKEYRQRVGGVIGGAGETQGEPLSPDEVRFGCQLFLGRVPTEAEVQKIARKQYTLSGLRDLLLQSADFRQRAGLTASQTADTPHTLIHLHMPKTAGTSLNVLLEQNYPREVMLDIHHSTLDLLRNMDPAARSRLRVIRGHLMHGLAAYLPHEATYVCLLRRPGPRIHSFYKYIRRQPKHPLHADLNAVDMSFGQFLSFVADRSDLRCEVDNGQCRRIAGLMTEAYFGLEKQVFGQALSHIFAPEMIYGLTDHFADFLALLKERGLLTHYSALKLNTAPESTDMDQVLMALTPAERGLYDGFIHWDDWLYDICEQSYLDRKKHKELV